ncbi:uncharacterized protein [Ptychodera flava]|uniref:uncharacterized protein n=1 Tax=Ptychodera flava TaxID=63121 RepID=UPI00396A30BC
MALLVFSILGLLSLSQAIFEDEGYCETEYVPELDDSRIVCRYHFEIAHDYCMTYNGDTIVSDCEDPDGNTVECVACYIDDPDCAGTDKAISFRDVKLSCDGVQRRIISVNGAVPGPAIRVKYGSIVRITLHNAMMQDSTTMHWHGVYQTKTPWMDGVPYITQCPIPPGGTFVYTFSAIPPGTFWYHSHTGVQYTEGMAGPLIIYEEDEPNQKYYDFNLIDLHDERHLPEYDQFIIMVSDWQHEESHHMFEKLFKAGGWFINGTRFDGARQFDGVEISPMPYTSGLVNGHGRYDLKDPLKRTPYYGYAIKPGYRYRFRVIGAQMVYSYRISIDDHKLKVITSDGFDLNPKDFDYIIVSAGERYDFVLEAKCDPEYTEYQVRADTMRFDEENCRPFNDTNASVLRYGDVSGVFLTDTLPPDRWRHCNKETNPCQTLNCPFGHYPSWSGAVCTAIADMTRSARELALDPTPSHVSKEAQIFMNFVFGGVGGMALGKAKPGQKPKPACNGKSFVFPTAPPYDPTSTFTECEPECDAADHHTVCLCTNYVTLTEHNYQFVFSSVGSGGSKNGSLHPIHIHGHSALVTKMGFPEQDEDGEYVRANQDLCCPCPENENECCSLDSVLVPCNKPRWRNDTWNEDPDSIPMNLYNPPRKDTILLPSGGYVIVRLEADNPGWWFIHCHIEHHLMGGMAIVLNSKPNEQPRPPVGGCGGCGSYDQDEHDFYEQIKEQEPELTNVALGGVASLSAGSDPAYGNDGNTQTCAMLDSEDKTWWKVDLGNAYKVYRVILKRPPNKWRDDLRCGPDYPLDDGSPAECDPGGIFPCCSPQGWCGNTDDHCNCGTCIDYTSKAKWRTDLRCGADYPDFSGEPGQCDPNGEFPCCSSIGWCGNTADHCNCDDCADYRAGGLVNTAVRVGSEENIEIHHQCGEVLTPRRLMQTITPVDCISPIVGRYVSIQSGRGNPVTLCEVSVMAPETPVEQPTFDSGCGSAHDLSGRHGSFSSMDYDGATLYENNVHCEFTITTGPRRRIELDFEALDLEHGSDFLYVVGPEGEEISTFTGSTVPDTLQTDFRKVTVIFTTNGSGQRTGFKINWKGHKN